MKRGMIKMGMASLLLCGAVSGTVHAGGTTAGATCTVGVTECDQYVAKYQSCINKQASGKAKDAAATAFKAQCDSLKQSATTPEGKAALKKSCQSLLDGLNANPMCK